eukprot:TRINITY_DN3126_c0_g1_i3.p1 TRINITY_DN3126_c0_g1~~TRINITY_DN3126_c0_g1_i3.p1  ORF type:complete len:315 (-),score=60.51 TRINITY_DN3126_c0_g1_i3:325-1269(-)
MIRRPPRSTLSSSSAASDVYKRQVSTQSTGKSRPTNMGRVKIPIAYRTDDRARRVTLCKRKKGLYKKAEELAKLCGVDVAVVIVGDGCKPAQMVSTGHGNYTDLPSTYRVLSRYSEMVTMTPLNTPAAALDARQTLKDQDRQLERQRREIEELRRQLAKTDPGSSLLMVDDENTESRGEEDMLDDDDELGMECIATPQHVPIKRRSPPSNRSHTSNATAEMPELSNVEVDSAIADMAAELKREGALLEAAGSMRAQMVTDKLDKEIDLMNMEDIDAFEFDAFKIQGRVLEAPWSGLPMVTSTEAVLGHCAPPLL